MLKIIGSDLLKSFESTEAAGTIEVVTARIPLSDTLLLALAQIPVFSLDLGHLQGIHPGITGGSRYNWQLLHRKDRLCASKKSWPRCGVRSA